MRTSRAAVLAAFLAASGGPLFAQEAKPDEPKPGEAKPAPPKSDAERLGELERQVDEQQKAIDALKRASPPVEKPGAPPPDEGAPQIGFKDGFFLKGKLNGSDYEIRPVGRIQLDYRAFPHSAQNDAFPHPVPQDQFLVRRAIVGFLGNFNVFAYDLEADTQRGSATALPLVAFWFEWRAYKEFRIRVGHYKTPFDLEDSETGDFYLDMLERPMVVGSGAVVAPDWRPGAEILGSFGDGIFKYWLSCQNQTDLNTVNSGDPLTAVRLQSDIQGFSVGAGAVWDNRSGIQNSFPGNTPGFFQFFTPVSVRGWTQRYAVDACYYQGPFFGRGEFVYASQERWRVLADHKNGTGLVTQGFSVTAGFMFAGPPRESKHPLKPFEGWQLFSMDVERKKNTRNVGAELVVRLEWVGIDDTHGGRVGQGGAVALPSTKPNADKVRGNECKAVTVGVNLDVIENVRVMADWVHLWIGDQARAERAHTRFADEILLRAQLEF